MAPALPALYIHADNAAVPLEGPAGDEDGIYIA
jgi:hypothetical protein